MCCWKACHIELKIICLMSSWADKQTNKWSPYLFINNFQWVPIKRAPPVIPTILPSEQPWLIKIWKNSKIIQLNSHYTFIMFIRQDSDHFECSFTEHFYFCISIPIHIWLPALTATTTKYVVIFVKPIANFINPAAFQLHTHRGSI